MKRNVNEKIEHRGNDSKLTSQLMLEMRLIRNMNQEEPTYSFDESGKSSKK